MDFLALASISISKLLARTLSWYFPASHSYLNLFVTVYLLTVNS